MLARNEQRIFDGQRLEVVNYFTYLGLTLSIQLFFNRMALEQANRAKKVLISLLNSLYDLGQLQKDVFFQLFDRKIKYHAALWIQNMGLCEKGAC